MQAASSNATALARSRALLGRTLRRRKSTAAAAAAAASFADEDTHDSTSDPGRAPHYPHLFQPLSLGPAIGSLPNRCIMGSMHTGLEGHSIPRLLLPLLDHDRGGHHDGHGDDGLSAMAEYFRARAEGGCGLMVTGGISPNRAGWVSPFAAKLSTRAEMERHRVVADAVHAVEGAFRQAAPIWAGTTDPDGPYRVRQATVTDTDELLAAVGYDADAVRTLREEGVIA